MSDAGAPETSAVGQPDFPAPWGYLATFGWVLLAAALSGIAGFIAIWLWQPDLFNETPDVVKNGPLISATTIVSAVVEIAVLAWAARLAHWPPAGYFGLVLPSGRAVAIAFACLIPFLLGYDALSYLLGKDVVTSFQTETYRTAKAAGWLPLLWLAFVVAAPVSEEIVFRGFLFRGWVRSARSVWPAILVISLLFAAMHVQYDLFGIAQVFAIGVLLAVARWLSGSTALTILMHATVNAWATLQSVIAVEWMS